MNNLRMRKSSFNFNKGTQSSIMEENAYKKLLDEIPDFIFLHDLDGRFLEINRSVKTLIGMKEENLLGHKVPEFLHPKYRDEFSEYIARILKNGEESGTMLVIDSNNKTRILEYHSKVVKRQGFPFGIRGIARDITEQKRIERELKDRETLYRTLFENAEDAIFLMENDIFIDCNPKTLKMFACQKEDIVGKPPYLFSPEYQADGITSKQKALEKIEFAMEGIPQRFEWQHKRLDGKVFDTIVSLYRIEVQKRFLLVAMVHDMSPQKSAIRALENSEKKYREVVENANVIILRCTPDGIFTFINRFGEEFFGYKREELLGKRNTIGTILPATGESSEKLKAMFRNICTNPEEYYENENLNLTKDGREVFIAWRNQPIMDEQGNLKEILSIGADVTRLRKLERELLHAKKMEAIGTLAGGIAHDFNNILGGMMGYLSLLKEQHKPEDPHYAILERIESATEQTSELVKQLLAFSMRGKFESKPIDMNIIVQNVLKILRRSVTKKISIITDLEKDLSMTEGDSSQLEQVIMNICVNAAQAMPEGGELKIRTAMVPFKELPKDMIGHEYYDRYILISILDTGIGMDSSIQEHIFEPFFTTKDKQSGTGLGLSISYGIIKEMNGEIMVESTPSSCTKLRVQLPITKS